MEDNISKIKDRIDIVDLISGYIKVQKAGANFKACCPFHNEKTPSFYVSPERQIWHCFGCGIGGSIFDFVMQMESIDFPEALKILAQRAGIELSGFDREFQGERVKLLGICERAAKFFEKQLWESNTGRKALEYLRKRGVSDQSIKDFRLGFAPDSWDSLLIFLKNSGHRAEDIEKAGLAVKKDGGAGHYDRFRSRIMFPITDINSQVMGFTGRIFGADDKEIAKYVNTPQTVLYDKSRILYGLDKAKKEIKQKGSCLVVEGNMDVVMSHQVGVANCVASSGTALTDQHAVLLKRYANNLDLCFDADSAGQMATERGVALTLSRGFNVNVVAIDDPECKDPADYVQKYGAKWQEQVLNKKALADFYIQQAVKTHDPEKIEGKKMIIAKILPLLKSMSNAVEQSHWLAELALKLKVKEDDLRLEMKKAAFLAQVSVPEKSPTGALSKTLEYAGNDVIEDYLVSLLMKNPAWYKVNHEKINEDFFTETAKLALAKLKSNDSAKLDFTQFAAEFPEQHRNKAEIWRLQSQADWMDIEEHEFEGTFLKTFNLLKKRQILAKLAKIEYAIKEAEKQKDQAKTMLLAKQFSDLSLEIKSN